VLAVTLGTGAVLAAAQQASDPAAASWLRAGRMHEAGKADEPLVTVAG
jgi:hypothetical protein